MKAPKITIRSARVEDAATIARAVAMAIGDKEALRAYCGDDYMAVLTQIAATKGTQYSWQYALVAEVDGTAAGAVVGYDGDDLQPLREGTFAIVRQLTGRVPNIANETEGGEYYLDSVGVLPEFRGEFLFFREMDTELDLLHLACHCHIRFLVSIYPDCIFAIPIW